MFFTSEAMSFDLAIFNSESFKAVISSPMPSGCTQSSIR